MNNELKKPSDAVVSKTVTYVLLTAPSTAPSDTAGNSIGEQQADPTVDVEVVEAHFSDYFLLHGKSKNDGTN
jgi:hypothetical protein